MVKVICNFAECAEIYGFPRAVRRHGGGDGYHRLPVATPWGNVDRPMMPDALPTMSDTGRQLMDSIHAAALADPWGLGLTMGVTNPLFDAIRARTDDGT
jgi:hypothetical protein